MSDAARSAPPRTPAERREQSLSFGDQESLVYQALLSHLGDGATDDDGEVDIWIRDMAEDWVVWYSYTDHDPGPGYWRLAYSLDDDGAVVFTGDPEQVVMQTSYVPAEAKKGTVPAPQRREARRGRPAPDRAELRAVRDALRNVREVRRCPAEFELREVANGTGGTDLLFTGYASVTGDDNSYEMEDWLGPWEESVSVGAFRKTLAEGADVCFLVNHEGMSLARTKPGTLTLSEHTSGDTTGLYSEARLDSTNLFAQALRSAVARGDIDEMSFAFRVTRQEWNDDYDRRWVQEVNLDKADVSAVNYGANPHTAGLVAMRKAGAAGPSWRAYLKALKELREGKTLSDDTMGSLQAVLDLVSHSDDDVDQAQILIAQLMGVPNPDDDDQWSELDKPNDVGDDADQDQLGSKVALHIAALPNHTYEARARLAALRGGRPA